MGLLFIMATFWIYTPDIKTHNKWIDSVLPFAGLEAILEMMAMVYFLIQNQII